MNSVISYYKRTPTTQEVFHNNVDRKYVSDPHLKDGVGELCAGHTKLNEDPRADLNEPSVSEFVENFGAEVPIGSKIQNFL